jgi:adenosine deaminase
MLSSRMVLALFGAALGVSTFLPVQLRGQVVTPAEARAERALGAAKKLGPPAVYALLEPMPKGADLHMHLSGAVYAETFIAEAVKQGMCVDPAALKLVPHAGKEGVCALPLVPAGNTLTDQHLYDALVDSFSMRSFVPHAGVSGHDQFFDTFGRFDGLKDFAGEWLDEVATRAARQNEQYLEIMQTPPFSHAAALGYKLGWPAGAEKNISAPQLADLRTRLIAAGLKDEVAVDTKTLADAKAERSTLENCAEKAAAKPACAIQIHWLYQVLRAFPPQQVFAQTLLGFEVANADPDVVGINFVQPEDARLAMSDYHLQMEMLDYLHSVYPKVHITLHAGELAFGLVPPVGMTFHIREAIGIAHAQRIGHGVDVLYENDAPALLKEMADKHVMVEINLTSNEVILGIKGRDHSLAEYRAAHVPVALSTDDEGVSRIDLTHEYVKGVEEQDLTYHDLKQMARTSLEHAFLAGESLWAKQDEFTAKRAGCPAAVVAPVPLSKVCQAFLDANEKAAQQFELEKRFAAFEAAQK